MSSLDNFKEYELYPCLFDRIDAAFPELNFRRRGARWESNYHLNGDKDSQGKPVSFVYGNSKFMAIDHSRSEKKSLIDLYKDLKGVDFLQAITALATLCSLSLPDTDSEEWKRYREDQESKEKANALFVNSLWGGSAEALRVLSYLKGRGWTEEEIKKAELGLITSQAKGLLPDSLGLGNSLIGTTHLLTIPYRNGSRLLGFKFREVGTSTGTKYLNSQGLQKSRGLFGIGVGVDDVVIVEGELDALHAQAKGADNVVATTGGTASATQIEDAIKRGVKKFTLLFDNDQKGRAFIKPAIEAIQAHGGQIFVASIPEGYKDLDEYLKSNSLEDYNRNIVRAADTYAVFLANDIIGRYLEIERSTGTFTPKDRADLFGEIRKLMNSPYIEPYERRDVLKILEDYAEPLNIRMVDFEEWANGDYQRKQAKQRIESVKRASADIRELVEQGRTEEALKLMGDTAEKERLQEKSIEFSKAFAPFEAQQYDSYLSEIKRGLPTGYSFSQGGITERLTLNPGLTFVCGYRGHGKTSFLNNLALNEVKRNLELGNGKSVLYFSYEVDKRRLIIDLLNTFVNDKDLSQNPYKTLLSYFKGEPQYFSPENVQGDGCTHLQYFEERKHLFFSQYLSSGALTIVDENYRVERLLDAIRYHLSKREASMVCIDYAQLIYSEEFSRARTEEIKKIVNDIKDFANREGIPFVLAAQFNREVESPVSVDTKNIGEGGDFERIADTCIGLFNLKELHPLPRKTEEEKAAKKLLSALGVADYGPEDSLQPIQGKLFVRLMKRRYGYYPLDTILEWEGRTKYITPNDREALSLQGEQTELFNGGEDAPAPF